MKKSIFERVKEWLYKYSDDLSNFFGGLFCLSIGYILFAGIIYVLNVYLEWAFTLPKFWVFPELSIIALIASIISLWAIFHFAHQEQKEIKISNQKTYYLISEWSLKTLATAGVSEDIVEFLDELRKSEIAVEKELKMTLPSEDPDIWLNKLKSALGTARVTEHEDKILKYTRREIPKTEN